ncbi:hypothetical protein NOR_06882 [Metarhizium rileyi]|uniref:Mss4-like protein n=2 Tax=Metarhizium rileyi (strain RCEF 4871) TaxID=1649241 RepID=A0A166ZQ38_METRR|nr:hypothetical protein NOR_06882 [Metarhizium rileyi RCEF 4871]
MSTLRPLRGSCLCGRNRYIIALPEDGINEAQVLFSTERSHQEPLATPLAAYIRVPLSWLHSTTFAFFDDETHTMIRRVYTHPSQDHAKRQFCGFCGTPLSYWSEEPRSEAEYINLTLGSLLQEDLQDLEDLGLIPEETESEPEEKRVASPNRGTALRHSFGVPWFDGMVEGTRLGRMRRTHGIRSSEDGTVKIEWEIIEESDGPDSNDVEMETESASSGKRKLQDRDG